MSTTDEQRLREAAIEVVENHAVADSDKDYCVVHFRRLQKLALAIDAVSEPAAPVVPTSLEDMRALLATAPAVIREAEPAAPAEGKT